MKLMIDSFTPLEQQFLLTLLGLIKVDESLLSIHKISIHKSVKRKLKRALKNGRGKK